MKLKLIALFCGCVGYYQLALGQPALKSRQQSIKSVYQSQLQTWCDALIALQVQGGTDVGGILSKSHQFVHGRCGDAVYPFLTLYKLTGNEKYRTAARKVFKWSEAHVSQPDGSWVNEAGGKNDWKGISCFSTIALGEALRHHSDVLASTENKLWRERLRKGGDFLLSFITVETGDINYPISAAAALAVCWKVLGDEKYLVRARELAHFGLNYFTDNQLIWGEGVRGINDVTPKGLRPIDVSYNLEESLPNLALYGTLTGDTHVLDVVTTSLQAHLNWILPDGGLDAGWCSRQYKWIYFGSMTTDGCASGFALLANRDERFGEAAFRNLQLMQSYTHNGVLYGGAALFSRAIPASSHHTFTRAKGLAAVLDVGISEPTAISLPNDKAYGVREWPEASVVQVALGPWRASITTNDIDSSPKRGGHPMGGALSMLWHQLTGPVAVASMNDYVLYEKSNMQQPTTESEQVCLTPRIDLDKDGNHYSNLYDSKAQMTWANKGDSIEVEIKGDLRDLKGNVLPGESSAFAMKYTFTNQSFQLAVHASAKGARLLFPVISPASEPIKPTIDGELVIQKKSSTMRLTGHKTPEWNKRTGDRVFNFVPGFEAVVVENKLDDNGNGHIRIVIK
ncbi:hypothetical protein [Spirosoma arcticum]